MTKNIDYKEILHRIRHWLPTQAPLKDFVHHNTLHAFQALPFHEGVSKASKLYGAEGYMSVGWFQDQFRQGTIADGVLAKEIGKSCHSPEEANRLQARMLGAYEKSGKKFPRRGNLTSEWHEKIGVELHTLVHPQFIRYVCGFLDQGIAVWRMPHAPVSFLNGLRKTCAESLIPFIPLNTPLCRELLAKEPEEIIATCLDHIVGSPHFHEQYLTEMLLAHAGWSGMIAYVESNPECLLDRRAIKLNETVAFELLLQLGWLQRKLGEGFEKVDSVSESVRATSGEVYIENERTRRVWQEAFERSQYNQLLSVLKKNHARPKTTTPPKVQAFFCIDDREGAIRRVLEERDSTVQTYGTPGFYAVDFLFQGLDDGFPVQHCPVVIRPRHVVREAASEKVAPKPPRLGQLLHFEAASNTVFRGWLITQFLGFWSAVRLAMNVFFPRNSPAQATSLSQVNHHARLHLLRESDVPTPEGYLLGYSLQEMADRVKAVLQSIGLTRDFAPFIVAFAHGSSSTNNPHFSAYDCGACAGKPGGANSRAFAQMANMPEVRKLLRGMGIDLPSTTKVIGALHDTTRDEARYFDLDLLSAEDRKTFEAFQQSFEEALKQNAKERCRRFLLIPTKISPVDAQKEVRRRSAAIFEPRPELNHATHFFGIVGRRDITRGLFLDRRGFLNSYDPTTDPKGEILGRILNAFIPVCGGINLEYYFSRVDPEVYGAGTKLPHNVAGLIGVSNGVDGDLRTGLPTQMTEAHDPLRLLVLVEQTPELALAAVKGNPSVYEWVENEWVRYACITPNEGDIYLFDKGKFNRWEEVKLEARTAATAEDLYANERENCAFGLLEGRKL